eukprot:2324297-Amphidinium_carterae.1
MQRSRCRKRQRTGVRQTRGSAKSGGLRMGSSKEAVPSSTAAAFSNSHNLAASLILFTGRKLCE